MRPKPKISLITVVYNSVKLIEDTIISIKSQNYENLQYIVVDGGSTDGTLEVLKKYRCFISDLISENDRGMYDGLAKGLKLVSGDICGYLNSGDLLHPNALNTIGDIFNDCDTSWICGYKTTVAANNSITKIEIPFRYRTPLIRAGVYGRLLPYLQQESTFWRSSLNDTLDYDALATYRLAGDYFIWNSFSKSATIDIVTTPLGMFRKHKGQLSENQGGYWNEVRSFSTTILNPKTFIQSAIEGFFWLLGNRLQPTPLKNHISFNHAEGLWVKTSH